MPWVVKKIPDKGYCVVKQGETEPIPGGCHTDRKAAIDHMQAINMNVKEFSGKVVEDKLCFIRPFRFSEADVAMVADTNPVILTKWIQAIPYGEWDHPWYGMSLFDEGKATLMKYNFDNKFLGADLLTDYDHGLDPAKGGKASGRVLSMDVRTDGLYWNVEFTEEATEEISASEWYYFSPEYSEVWENPMDNTIYSYIARGGGLTNKPWIKGMVPLNFSEVFVERTVMGEENEDKTGADGTENKGEHAEQEHSEPGQVTDQPSTREGSEGDKSGDKDNAGQRRDKPGDAPAGNADKEGDMVISAKVREALGLGEDATTDQIEEAVVAMATEVAPLREAAKSFSEKRRFAEQYPEEAAKLATLEQRDRESESKKFSERYERFKIEKEDKSVVTDTKGFSALVLDKIQEAHKKFSEGVATSTDMQEVLDLIASGKGIVDYGEGGSERQTERVEAEDSREAAKMLSEKALEIQAEAGGAEKMSWGDAIAKASADNPELAKKYSERTVR